MLRCGISRKMFSEQHGDGDLPEYIWYVRATDGAVFEAKLGGSSAGKYHGYPLPEGDSRRERILSVWKERES